MHPIQDLFLEGFSYVLQFDMHFYMHSYLDKKIYSCKKWVLQQDQVTHNKIQWNDHSEDEAMWEHEEFL
jgi:hypothetical protein